MMSDLLAETLSQSIRVNDGPQAVHLNDYYSDFDASSAKEINTLNQSYSLQVMRRKTKIRCNNSKFP